MNKIFILILFFICLVIYLNSLNNDFVLDDESFIVENPLIKSQKSLFNIFKSSSLSSSPYDIMYRPFQVLTYGIDYTIWGLKPFGFHLTSIIFHLFNSILVYYLLYALLANKMTSIGGTILFLVHPIHVSSVAYISGRADVLACFFMLLSSIWFIKFITKGSYIFYSFSLLSAIFALFSRENAMLLFINLFLIIFVLNKKSKYYLFVIPFILLDFCYIFLRFFIFGKSSVAFHPSLMSLPLRIVNFLNIIPRYLSVLIFPLDLHMFRTTPFITNFLDLRFIFSLVFIFFVIFLLIKFRVNKLVLFSAIWFFAGLLPVFLFFDGYAALNKAVMAESWLYISSIGFFILFAFLCSILKKIGKVLLIIFIIFYMVLTVINNLYFKNNIILYENILSYNAGANPLRKGLIKAYLMKGLYEEAFLQIQELKIYYPESYDFYFYSGLYNFLAGNLDKAIEEFNLALNKEKNYYCYYNLSICYAKKGQLTNALNSALESYRLNPYFLLGVINLGDLYRQKGESNTSEIYYQKALNLDPKNEIIKRRLRDNLN